MTNTKNGPINQRGLERVLTDVLAEDAFDALVDALHEEATEHLHLAQPRPALGAALAAGRGDVIRAAKPVEPSCTRRLRLGQTEKTFALQRERTDWGFRYVLSAPLPDDSGEGGAPPDATRSLFVGKEATLRLGNAVTTTADLFEPASGGLEARFSLASEEDPDVPQSEWQVFLA
jgi:hypothetical protein